MFLVRPRFTILLLLALACSSLQATITIQPWTPIYRGVDFTTGQADAAEPRRHQVVALRVDLTDPTIEFFSTPDNGTAALETFGQTTTTFVQSYGVAVGVNANFFSPVNTTPNDPRELNGLAISRGTIVSAFENGRPAVIISRSNQVSFHANAPANYNNSWAAVSGSDRVVVQGANNVSTNCTTSFCGANPRTAVGVSQDGRYFYMIVIDGRQPGWSDGATLVETGDWLIRFGCWNGLNLDGGGSSAMARLQNGTATLLNRPSGGVQRVNGNHLGVYAQPLTPSIVTHPQNRTVNIGNDATFTVTASGAAPLSYRWRFNGTTIAGATASIYTRSNAQPAHAGNYSVVVSNLAGTATSSNALLAFNSPPVISSHPQSQAVLRGQPASFTVAVQGTSPFYYRWHFDGVTIPGATSAVHTVAAALATHQGSYSVTVSNGAGVAVSSNATLTVVDVGGWGDNASNQIKIPTDSTNIVAVAAGGWHSLALRRNGSVAAWGHNWNGQCNVPIDLHDAVAIAAGGYHSLAIRRDGRLSVWGADDFGQLAHPASLCPVIAIAAGTWHSLALAANGTVAAWGDNAFGQTNVPPEATNIVAIAAGGAHNLALRADGTVIAWGANQDDQGNVVGQSIVPPGLSNVLAIAAGGHHSLALKIDGTVVGWGSTSHGQSSVPNNVTGVVAVAAGARHSLALRADGAVVGWGNNDQGQANLSGSLTNIVAIAAGEQHTLGLIAGTQPVPQILRAAWNPDRFVVTIQTLHRHSYQLQHADSLTSTNWIGLPPVPGNGALLQLQHPDGSAQQFFRVRY